MLQNMFTERSPSIAFSIVFSIPLERQKKNSLDCFGDLTLGSENYNNGVNDNQNFNTSNENYNNAIHDNENDNTSNDIQDIISVATDAWKMSCEQFTKIVPTLTTATLPFQSNLRTNENCIQRSY